MEFIQEVPLEESKTYRLIWQLHTAFSQLVCLFKRDLSEWTLIHEVEEFLLF